MELHPLSQPQIRQLLGYPHGNQQAVQQLASELQQHQIASIYAAGPRRVAGIPVLGLGYGGLVILVKHQEQMRVLKIRRTDAGQTSLCREAAALSRANEASIGPRLVAHSSNFLIMDYLVGPAYYHWLRTVPPLPTLKANLRQLLAQARQLDRLGLDHGELRCVSSHVVATQRGPAILDFGSASFQRRPANLTQLVQGLWIGTRLAEQLRPRFAHVEKSALVHRLRAYKQQPNSATFEALLQYLGLWGD